MKRSELLGLAVVVVVSGAGGWHLRDGWIEAFDAMPAQPHALVPPALPAPPPSASRDAPPAAEVPPSAMQLVRPEPASAAIASAASPSTAHGCPEAPQPGVPDAAETALLLQALREGAEPDRHAALLALLAEGGQPPLHALRDAFESDVSERVRLLAFSAYADAIADDIDATRAALDVAQYSTSAALRDEAKRRSAELEALQSVIASMPRQETR